MQFKTHLAYKTMDGVAQWVARLTCSRWMPVSHELEPQQRSPLFP